VTKIPVLLLTGFLGSGKTTLLNRLLRDPRYEGTAIVINEAGDIGVDQALVVEGTEDVVLLEGGCICCRLRGSLNETLHRLNLRRKRGEVGFRRIVVETSGLSDPAPILAALVADAAFMRDFVVSGIVTVVDSVNFADTHRRFAEARMQVGLADRLVLAKTDMVDEGAAAEILERLARLNPDAEIVTSQPDASGGDLLWVDAAIHAERPPPARFHASEVSGDICSAALNFPGTLQYDAINSWLDHTASLFGADLLRLKGVLLVDEAADPVILHGVQGFVYSPASLRNRTVETNSMVLIGHGIARQDLDDALARLAALAL
jgi:G3E family GTPase